MDIQLAGLEAYTDDVWDWLPSDASAFTINNGNPVDETHLAAIGNIFARNKVQDRLGLYVNHRHFGLEPGERLVEYGTIQTPWQLRNAANEVKSCIAPKTWAFHGETLMPTEFKFSPDSEAAQSIEVPIDFLGELRGYLEAHGLTNLLGISTYPDNEIDPRTVFELTVGRVSMIVPNNRFPDETVVHVGWFFDESGAKVARDCLKCSWHT